MGVAAGYRLAIGGMLLLASGSSAPLCALAAPVSQAKTTLEAAAREVGGVRLGAEIEVDTATLAKSRIVDFFDWSEYQRAHPDVVEYLPLDALENYLEDPGSFNHLPAELQEELAQGLTHFKPAILAPDSASAPDSRGILDARGEELKKQKSGLILPESGGRIAKPAAVPEPTRPGQILKRGVPIPQGYKEPSRGELILGSNTLAQRDWEEAKRRWKALSTGRKKSAVLLERFSPIDKAIFLTARSPYPRTPIVRRYPNGMIATLNNPLVDPRELKPKALLPDDLKQWGTEFEWGPDGEGVLEFRHRKPVASPSEYLRSVEGLARRLGIWQRMQEPASFIGTGYSYHQHVSFPGRADIRPQLDVENVRLMLHALEKDVSGVIDARSPVSLRSAYTGKGMVRAVSDGPGLWNHGEQRFHFEAPEAELHHVIRSLGSKTVGSPEFEALLKARLTPELIGRTIDQIDAQRGNHVFVTLTETLGRLQKAGALGSWDPHEVYAQVLPRYLNSGNPDTLKTVTRLMLEGWGGEERSAKALLEAFRRHKPNSAFRTALLTHLERSLLPYNPGLQDLALGALGSADSQEEKVLISYLERSLAESQELRKGFLKRLGAASPDLRKQVEKRLEANPVLAAMLTEGEGCLAVQLPELIIEASKKIR